MAREGVSSIRSQQVSNKVASEQPSGNRSYRRSERAELRAQNEEAAVRRESRPAQGSSPSYGRPGRPSGLPPVVPPPLPPEPAPPVGSAPQIPVSIPEESGLAAGSEEPSQPSVPESTPPPSSGSAPVPRRRERIQLQIAREAGLIKEEANRSDSSSGSESSAAPSASGRIQEQLRVAGAAFNTGSRGSASSVSSTDKSISGEQLNEFSGNDSGAAVFQSPDQQLEQYFGEQALATIGSSKS